MTRCQAEVHHADDDVELGRLLKRKEGTLVSFGADCAALTHKAGKKDRAAFRAYLGELKGKMDDKELEEGKVEKTRDEALKHFDEQLTQGGNAVPGLPPGYFNSRRGSSARWRSRPQRRKRIAAWTRVAPNHQNPVKR